jgi:ribA/ribD-fused uncharacterized protein
MSFILFFRPNEQYGYFSQWYYSSFIDDDGVEYNTAEQYIMYQKAMLFDDKKTANMIMNAKNPKIQKKLGKKVIGFDEETWNMNCEGFVFRGNFLKFSQSENLKKKLLDTKDNIIVEASPYDKIWGIGLCSTDSRAHNIKTWKGANKLGKILMEVRNTLN